MGVGESPMTRRGLLGAAGGAITAALLAGCTNAANTAHHESEGEGKPFDFVDDRGERVHLPHRPQRIVAYSGSAASLWEYGIRPVALFGPQRLRNGQPDPQIGAVDLNAVTSLGEAYNDFDVPKYISLRPDLLVCTLISEDAPRYVPPDSTDEILAQAPLVGLRGVRTNADETIARYEQLAVALGANAATEPINASRKAFREATARLKAAALAKPGLRVVALSANRNVPFLGNPTGHSDLRYFAACGLDITHVDHRPEVFIETTWERIDEYPADLILYDARTMALTLDELRGIDVFNQLPAVRRGALAPWRLETPYTHRAYAEVANELAAAVERAEPGIA